MVYTYLFLIAKQRKNWVSCEFLFGTAIALVVLRLGLDRWCESILDSDRLWSISEESFLNVAILQYSLSEKLKVACIGNIFYPFTYIVIVTLLW